MSAACPEIMRGRTPDKADLKPDGVQSAGSRSGYRRRRCDAVEGPQRRWKLATDLTSNPPPPPPGARCSKSEATACANVSVAATFTALIPRHCLEAR